MGKDPSEIDQEVDVREQVRRQIGQAREASEALSARNEES